jgi:hypothetical protein
VLVVRLALALAACGTGAPGTAGDAGPIDGNQKPY